MTVVWRQPPAFNEEVTAFHLQRRVGTRDDFGHDLTTPGNECLKLVEGLLPATAYQFRVRAVNRMGVGRWSGPSALCTTDIDVPDALVRPEVREVTPFSIGVEWEAPTAVVEGTSISKFVVQLAGGGVSYQDNVLHIVPWTASAANHRCTLMLPRFCECACVCGHLCIFFVHTGLTWNSKRCCLTRCGSVR